MTSLRPYKEGYTMGMDPFTGNHVYCVTARTHLHASLNPTGLQQTIHPDYRC